MNVHDIEEVTKANNNFRKVLETGKHSQLVVMNIPVGSEIGEEVHEDTDQVIVVVDGTAEARVEGDTYEVDEDALVFVPAGKKHNIVNNGDADLKLYTIYAPAHHPAGTIHKTKAEAQRAE